MTTRCLDLSRLVSRVGQGAMTGIDRVEFAYLREVLRRDGALFALVRTRLGFVLLDRGGALALFRRLSGAEEWGPPDLAARLTRGATPARGRAEADLRRLALSRCRPRGLARMLRAHLAPGASYLNVGHANLSPAVLAALKAVPGLRIAVLIHDTIPLDHPEYQRPDQPARFEALLRATGAFADLVICNSAFTESRARHHLARLGPVPETMVAHLGLDLGLAAPGALPAGVDPAHPRFVVLGTIEPRKNHRLLLEIWARLGSDPDRVPHLHIVGRRGWMNAEVFRILDTAPFMGRTVFEHPALPDAQVAALLRGARGLLFPSHAEGFGLPPLEAAALGVPVICATHPIYSEILGDYPLYLNNADSYSWETAIKAWAGWGNSGNESAARPTGSLPLPAWEAHFARVLARV